MSAPGAQHHVDLSPPLKTQWELKISKFPSGGEDHSQNRAQSCLALTSQGVETSKREHPKELITHNFSLSRETRGQCVASRASHHMQGLGRPGKHREAYVETVISVGQQVPEKCSSCPFLLMRSFYPSNMAHTRTASVSCLAHTMASRHAAGGIVSLPTGIGPPSHIPGAQHRKVIL